MKIIFFAFCVLIINYLFAISNESKFQYLNGKQHICSTNTNGVKHLDKKITFSSDKIIKYSTNQGIDWIYIKKPSHINLSTEFSILESNQNFIQSNFASVTPNPVTQGTFDVNIFAETESNINIHIFNILGIEIFKTQRVAQQGYGVIHFSNIVKEAGIYYYVIEFDNELISGNLTIIN